MVKLELAEDIGSFLCQEGFSPQQQALGETLLACCEIVSLAVEIERAAGEGREREALKQLLVLMGPAHRALNDGDESRAEKLGGGDPPHGGRANPLTIGADSE